jgi:MFS family permease
VASALWLGDLAYLAAVATGTTFSAGAIAVTFAVFLGVNGLARAVVGRVSDRFGRREILAAMLLVGGVAQVLLLAGAHRGALGALLLGAGGAALSVGCCFPLCSALVRDYFGSGAAPQNFGIIYGAKAIGGVFGIGLVAATGGASPVLAGTAALGVLGAAAAVRLRQPGRPAVVLP